MDGIRKSSGSACWQSGGRWRSPELTGAARDKCMVDQGVVPRKGAGRPRKIHPVGQMVLQHLGQRREELMVRCRDRFRNFRVEVAVLFLAGYSPCMARGFFEDVFCGEHNRQIEVTGGSRKGFSISGFERAYRLVDSELKSGDLVGRIGPGWLAELKEHRLGPWAPDAPEWMRDQFGVSAEAMPSGMEPPTGLPTAALGALPAPVVPPSVAEIPPGVFVPLACPVAAKSAAEKVRELDEYIAGVEARFGPLGLQLRDYTRALEVGFFVFMAERDARTRIASGGSGGSDDGCLESGNGNPDGPKGESGPLTESGDESKGGAAFGNSVPPAPTLEVSDVGAGANSGSAHPSAKEDIEDAALPTGAEAPVKELAKGSDETPVKKPADKPLVVRSLEEIRRRQDAIFNGEDLDDEDEPEPA